MSELTTEKDDIQLVAIKYDVEKFENKSDFLEQYNMDNADYEHYLKKGLIKEMGTFNDNKDILKLIKKATVCEEIISELLDPYSELNNDELIRTFIGDSEHFHIFSIGHKLYFSDCCVEITLQ